MGEAGDVNSHVGGARHASARGSVEICGCPVSRNVFVCLDALVA